MVKAAVLCELNTGFVIGDVDPDERRAACGVGPALTIFTGVATLAADTRSAKVGTAANALCQLQPEQPGRFQILLGLRYSVATRMQRVRRQPPAQLQVLQLLRRSSIRTIPARRANDNPDRWRLSAHLFRERPIYGEPIFGRGRQKEGLPGPGHHARPGSSIRADQDREP